MGSIYDKLNFSMHNPPQFLYIEITPECNLRCKQCHHWMLKESDNSLKTEDKLNLIRQFHKMNKNGEVVLTGGETMSKIDEFFALTSLCRSLNLKSAANTNATYISEEIVEKTLVQGPGAFVISLDSHLEHIHDYIRGVITHPINGWLDGCEPSQRRPISFS